MLTFELDVSIQESGRGKRPYNLDTDLNGEVTLKELLEFMRSALIIAADQALKEEQARGFDPKPVITVDGRVNKPILSVNPFGKIEINSRVDIDSMVIDTYEGLLHRSQVDTGLYKSSHYVFLNGIQVATDMASLKTWLSSRPQLKDTDKIRFVNIQPYARKLERLGVTYQRKQTRTVKSKDKRLRSGERILAPNGTYFLTARAIRRKYKRNSSIKFTFISGSELGLTASFKAKKPKQQNRAYLYPTIVITVAERGLF